MEPNWAESIQGFTSIVAVIISLIGYIFIFRQIKQTNKSIEHSTNVAIYSISSEFYKFLAENSELRPYFYDNKPVEKDHNDFQKLLSVSENLADFFEFVLLESKSLDERIAETWKIYMKNIYNSSPIFRLYISRYQGNYTAEILEVFDIFK